MNVSENKVNQNKNKIEESIEWLSNEKPLQVQKERVTSATNSNRAEKIIKKSNSSSLMNKSKKRDHSIRSESPVMKDNNQIFLKQESESIKRDNFKLKKELDLYKKDCLYVKKI